MAGKTFRTDAELEADILALFAEEAALGHQPPVLELVRERVKGAAWHRILSAWKRLVKSGRILLRGRKKMFYPAGNPGLRKKKVAAKVRPPDPYPLHRRVVNHMRRERRLRRWASTLSPREESSWKTC